MHKRYLTPMAMLMALVLAGCQTPPRDSEQAAASEGVSSAPSSAPVAGPAVEFRLAQTEPGPGLTEVKIPNGALFVAPQPILTRIDLVEAAQLSDKQGQQFVGLRFNETGGRRLADESTRNVGKLLVMTIDNSLVAAPRIAQPLTQNVLIFGANDAASAAAIVNAIRGPQAQAPGTAPAPVPAPTPAPSVSPLPGAGSNPSGM